jgi:hypothetical protein
VEDVSGEIDTVFVDTEVAPNLEPAWPTLPACPTGRQIVGILNKALELSKGGGGIFWGSGAVQQKIRDAINAPKTELDMEIPFWPWSEDPTYCDGSPQKEKAAALLFELAGEPAAADKENERIKEKVKDAFAGWWAQLWGVIKVALVVAAILAAAWVVRSFRSIT